MTKILVVTGASRGIGDATAQLGAAAGYAVCVAYNESAAAAEEVVRAVTTAGGEAIAVQGDMGSADDIVRLFTEVDAALGPVTALVNNAAMLGGERRVDEAEEDHLARLWAVNFTGPFLCAREAIRRMSTTHGGKGGAIVNVSSLAGKMGGIGPRAHYAASKGALNAFTQSLAREVATESIHVNAVLPGTTATGIHDGVGGQAHMEAMAALTPMKRWATPEEVAETILWLLSDKASYVTGALLDVSGGY